MLAINAKLLESLIKLHEDSFAFCYPNGLPDDSIEHIGQNVGRMVSDPHGVQFVQLVEALELDERTELIALMFLGRETSFTADDFPVCLAQAERIQGEGVSAYLFSKSALPRYWKQGMVKLGLE